MDPTLSRGRVVAAFPATGKTTLVKNCEGFIDSDSSTFTRGDDWPTNYITAIRDRLSEGWTVLVSTHAEVRQALADAGVPYTLVYPVSEAREEYRKRMEERGSPPVLVTKVCDELWDDALAECRAQEGCERIELDPDEYLSDVIG